MLHRVISTVLLMHSIQCSLDDVRNLQDQQHMVLARAISPPGAALHLPSSLDMVGSRIAALVDEQREGRRSVEGVGVLSCRRK